MVLLIAAALFLPVLAARDRADDRNHDGRPDTWRSYNRFGEVVSVALDTNFDGRADIQEYYERGALVRRESDRDFNDRVDLVQHFDPVSHEEVRALTDVNADGVADLLFLFRDGQPVYAELAPNAHGLESREASAGAASRQTRTGHAPLVPLDDPFSNELALRAVHLNVASADVLGPDAPFALPDVRGRPARADVASRVCPPETRSTCSPPIASGSPRGPPPSPIVS